ncbi:MAG: SIR2 family protein [Actinomycetota bacterium]
MPTTVHNPDRYMAELRQILAQGRKRIGMLLGAGAPASLKVNRETGRLDPNGEALIPTIQGLTATVLDELSETNEALASVRADLPARSNVEHVLSRVRSLSTLIGNQPVHGMNAEGFRELAEQISTKIGELAAVSLPVEHNAFMELAAWIGGTERAHPVEVFTPNYDLLIEDALERAEIPFFDGFTGTHEPFFDPATIARNDLPSRWARVWKLHGSIGWRESRGSVVRAGGRDATGLIYPDHLKYDHIQKLPFTALFDRLRAFLLHPDTLLVTCGFSYADAHISAVIDECLSANPSSSVFAFQFETLENATGACRIASKRTNMSVYARDGAQINTIKAPWRVGELPARDWASIRESYWRNEGSSSAFGLGDFVDFCRFISLIHAEQEMPAQDPAKEGAP